MKIALIAHDKKKMKLSNSQRNIKTFSQSMNYMQPEPQEH